MNTSCWAELHSENELLNERFDFRDWESSLQLCSTLSSGASLENAIVSIQDCLDFQALQNCYVLSVAMHLATFVAFILLVRPAMRPVRFASDRSVRCRDALTAPFVAMSAPCSATVDKRDRTETLDSHRPRPSGHTLPSGADSKIPFWEDSKHGVGRAFTEQSWVLQYKTRSKGLFQARQMLGGFDRQ